jgi:hypothetical protein
MGRHHSAGDIHDYFKYGLLRTLAYSGLKVGIHGYCTGEGTPPEYRNGPYTRYLGNPQRYRACDPELFNSLKVLQGRIQTEKGFLKKVSQAHLFPPDTLFYTDPLSFENIPLSFREQHRQGWFAYGKAQLQDCDVIFLDPKCGLEIKTVNPYGQINGPNYVSDAELASFRDRRQTVIIHQRVARSSVANALINYSQKIQSLMNFTEPLHHLQFNEGSPCLFLIMPLQEHCKHIDETLKAYRASNWGAFLKVDTLCGGRQLCQRTELQG